MLSNSDLSYMRASVNELLPDTCNILTVSRASDSEGGQKETWPASISGVPCRLDWSNGKEQVVAGALETYTGWVMSLPAETPVTQLNRIAHGGYTYSITSSNSGASWEVVRRLLLERIP